MSGEEQPSGPRPVPQPADQQGVPVGAQPGAQPGTHVAGQAEPHQTDWRRIGKRALMWVGLAAVAVAVALLLASFVPRWWSQQVGNLVEGSFALGVWWGLFFGSVFTVLPLIVAWQAARPGLSWQMRVGLGVLALVLATPNLLTLSVVLGTNNAAHAGERIFDVQAPAFRGATAWGAVIGFVVAVGFAVLWAEYRRRGRKLKAIEEAHRDGGSSRPADG